MNYKGSNLLHTIRQLIADDEKWRQILRGLNKDFYHQTVSTKQIEDYISKTSGMDLSKVFDQYLRTTDIPVFEYKLNAGVLKYRYTRVVDGFNMPLKIYLGGKEHDLGPSSEWKTIKVEGLLDLDIDLNYYVIGKRLE